MAGFSLAEIGGMLNAGHAPSIGRTLLSAKADEIDRTIRRLTALRDGLHHAADCPAPSHVECATFQRLRAIAADLARKRG